MQDAAYQVLLKDRKLAAHAEIARALTNEFSDAAEARPANIAHHFSAAQMWEKARTYWIEAAHEMQQFEAHREAVEYCKQALEANARCPGGDAQRDTEIDIREMMFVSQEVHIWWSPEYSENLLAIQDLRDARGDAGELVIVINGLAGAECCPVDWNGHANLLTAWRH